MNFIDLLRTTAGLITLRSSPAALPASYAVATLAALLYLTVSGWLYGELNQSRWQALMDLVILSALIFALLQWRDHADRLLQTVTAFLLCGAVTALVAAPILLSVPPSGGDLSVGASYILVAIMVWDLLISAHLLRCALSMPLLTGIVLAIVLTLVSVSVGNFLTSIMNSENSTVEAPVT